MNKDRQKESQKEIRKLNTQGQSPHHLYEDVPLQETRRDQQQKQHSENQQPEKQQGETDLLRMLHTLAGWFPAHARELEWRSHPTDYNVWVSEIMLQQTRVEAVKPYFRRFMEHFPRVECLAKAEEEELMKCWEGLGYYSRARNLQKTAVLVVEEYGGHLPPDYGKLLKLPGIGSYTAGAIASIAYGIPEPAVDGNVLRVMSRYFGSKEDIMLPKTRTAFEGQLREALRKENLDAGLVNQALMELGATVCVPNGAPLCEQCPLRMEGCIAQETGQTDQIPVKTPKKPRTVRKMTVFLVYDSRGKLLIRRREQKGLLAGLYEFPNIEGYLNEQEAVQYVKGEVEAYARNQGNTQGSPVCQIERAFLGKHIFTHIEWHMKVYEMHVSHSFETGRQAVLGGSFVPLSYIREEITLPTAFLQLLS